MHSVSPITQSDTVFWSSLRFHVSVEFPVCLLLHVSLRARALQIPYCLTRMRVIRVTNVNRTYSGKGRAKFPAGNQYIRYHAGPTTDVI